MFVSVTIQLTVTNRNIRANDGFGRYKPSALANKCMSVATENVGGGQSTFNILLTGNSPP